MRDMNASTQEAVCTRYRETFEYSPAPVVVTVAGAISDANNAACALLNASRDSIIGRPLSAFITIPSTPGVSSSLLRRADGGIRNVRVEVGCDPGGDCFVISLRDVTEEDRARELLDLSHLGKQTAIVAHEMNNVLMGIMPNAEILRRKATDDTTKQAAERVLKSVDRGRSIIRDITPLTRETVIEPFDTIPWMADLKSELRGIIPHLVALAVELPLAGAWIHGDKQQLNQVLINLVRNAANAIAHARPNGVGTIRIVAHSPMAAAAIHFGGPFVPIDSSYVHIAVIDDGPGIAEKLLPMIFQEFVSLTPGGMGLGLSVVRKFVLQNRGYIRPESTVGTGTTFHVYMPAAESVTTAIVPTDNCLITVGLRVLIVEDDEPVSLAIQMLLESVGLDVHCIDSGEQLETEIARMHPDVVLLDVDLPGISGDAIYEQIIRPRWPELPVIFMSGSGDPTRLTKFFGPNVAFLAKPYTFDTLAIMLRTVGCRIA